MAQVLKEVASRVGSLPLRLREVAHLKCYKWAGAKLKRGEGVGKPYYTGRIPSISTANSTTQVPKQYGSTRPEFGEIPLDLRHVSGI